MTRSTPAPLSNPLSKLPNVTAGLSRSVAQNSIVPRRRRQLTAQPVKLTNPINGSSAPNQMAGLKNLATAALKGTGQR